MNACLRLPPGVGAMHMHARAAHRGVGTHICSYSVTRALPLPRSPSSRGPLPAGGDGPTDRPEPPAAFPSPCTPGTTRGARTGGLPSRWLPRRVASPRANGHMDRPVAGLFHHHALPRRATRPRTHGPVISKAAGMQREGTGSLSSGEATSAPGSGAPAGLHAYAGFALPNAARTPTLLFFSPVTRRKIVVLFCLSPKTDSPWALL
jgi:hypothetical protein